MTKLRELIFLLTIALSTGTLSAADVLVLQNGDTIKGEFVSQANGIITFKSPILGTIQIPDSLAEVQSAPEVDEEVAGPAIPSAAEQQADAASGTTPAGNDEAEPTKTPEQIAAEAQAERFDKMIAEWKATFQSIIPEGWTGRINIGYTYTDSDSTTTSLITGFKAKKSSGRNHYEMAGFYEFGDTKDSNGVKTVNTDKYGGGFNYKYDLSERWFLTSTSSYLHDQVKEIKNQATEQVGLGYRIINEDDMKLNVNGGGALQYNNVAGVSQKWYYYMTLGNDFEYHFNKYFRVEQNFNIRLDPSETSQYQIYFNAAGIAKLTEWIEASLSYNYIYDSTVGVGTQKDEQRIIFALGVPF
ncbi:DUF481 domain-containing protein [Ruficoccus amylovorans]|uniref:DUF481 domain-containing protein n=1 Tax=Ruficoccus amylovorans TaxID=1804625 RepID=A0A842HGT0_9BACT|nr:DUF481 domain-containing protein [Ruficoccus amylovorans]MBC2594451.1 DUF481 domain-containing protein [Ruficoccus amylovorans]